MAQRATPAGLVAALLLLGAAAPAPAEEPTGAAAPAPTGAAAAAPAAALDGATLYTQRTCIACHGPDAKTPILPTYPKLAGQNADYAFQQMKDIKSGARSNGNTAAMAGIMHLVDEAEMRALADYISSLEP
jgi:cytochrome c